MVLCKEHRPGIQRPGLSQTIRNGPTWASIRLYGLFTSPRSRKKSHQPGKTFVMSEWQSEIHLIVPSLLSNPLPSLSQLLAESSSGGYRTKVPFPCWGAPVSQSQQWHMESFSCLELLARPFSSVISPGLQPEKVPCF